MRFFNSSLIDKLFVWVVGLFMASVFLLEGIDDWLVNEEQYISQSQEVRLDNYEIVDSMIAPHLFHASSNIRVIKAGNTHYAFYYYHKNKRDWEYKLNNRLNWSPSHNPTLFFPVHPDETVQGKGTADNPIHVFNFGLASKQYEWDDESYRYNIKKDFVCYQMFQCGRFAPWVYNTLFGLFALMPFIYLFRRMYLESLDRKRAAS